MELRKSDAGREQERARRHFWTGESHYAAGHYADAAREFALAYELSQRAEMLVNLSKAHERGGELRAAIADLELLLVAHPRTSYRGDAEQRLAELRSTLADHERPSASPVLAQTSSASAEPIARASPAKASPAKGIPKVPAPVSKPDRNPVWPPRRSTLGVAASAVAVAVVALGTGLRAHALYDELEGRCPDGVCREPFEEERARGRRLANISTGFSIAALALAGATAVLWTYDVRANRRRAALSAGVNASFARVSAHVRAEF